MLGNNPKSKNGKDLPQDWLDNVTRIMDETYKDQCLKYKSTFDAFGQIYDEELLLVVSFIAEQDAHKLPIACFLSCEKEHIATTTKIKETQKNYLDILGLLFDEIFSNEEWSDYEPVWQDITYKTETYSYKISRENVALTLEANKLLGDDFDEDF